MEQAVQYFQDAIDLDSDFALAYVGLAEAIGQLGVYGTLTPQEVNERMGPLLDRALPRADYAFPFCSVCNRIFAFGSWLEADEVRARMRVASTFGGVFRPNCAAVNPAKLARGLADAVERRGASIYEQTSVTGVETGRVHTNFNQTGTATGRRRLYCG